MTVKGFLKVIVYTFWLGILSFFDILALLIALDITAGILRLIGILIFEPLLVIIAICYIQCVKEIFK